MNILFCDFIFQKGNSHVDTEIIKSLLRNNDVTVMANRDRYNEELYRATFVENKHYIRKSGTFKIYYGIFRNMLLAAKYANRMKPDLVFISVYETRTFFIGRMFFREKDKLVILENANIDQLSNRKYRRIYDLFCKKVRHVVYEPYMKKYLCESIRIPELLISVIPHPCYAHQERQDYKSDDTIYDCIAISGSNDEEQIKEFVEYERINKILFKAKIRVLIKSKETKFDNGYLVVKDEYFSNSDYERYYESCKVVYTPFPYSYKYRMSGCFIDSFSHCKPIVSSPIMLAKYYEESFPDIIITAEKPADVIEQIIKLCSMVIENSCFDEFLKKHSGNGLDCAIDHLLEDYNLERQR